MPLLRPRRSCAIMLCVFVATALPARNACRADGGPVGSAFNYQGRLTQAGAAVNATADFQFSLWDAATGPGQIGSTQEVLGRVVVNGAFTIELDFGANAFGAEARWLEIAVRSPAGAGQFTTLAPRQRIMPSPVALYAL